MDTFLKIHVLGILCFSIIAMYGCEEKLTDADKTDEETIQDLVSELSDWFAVDGHLGKESEDPPIKEPIPAIFWWREVDRPIHRIITVDVAGDSAFATIQADIHGWFNIVIDVDPDSLIHKDLADSSIRHAVFKKDTVSTYHRGWRLLGLSGVEIVSDTNTVRVDSVRVEVVSTEWDTLIVDPLQIFSREGVLTLPPDVQVEVTAYTNDSTACVFLHTFRPWRPHRWRFRHRGNGVYHGFWYTPHRLGIHHAAVDIIHRDTIYDDEYPYDSNAWLLPYRVSPTHE